MSTIAPDPTTLVVVDHKRSDYNGLFTSVDDVWLEVCLLSSAGDALRLARNRTIGLWMINVRLPDLSGFDLVEMLRPQASDAAVVMVTDEYRLEDELRALVLGVTQYFCKPLKPSWFHQWWQRQRHIAAVGRHAVAGDGGGNRSPEIHPPGRPPDDDYW